MVVNEQYIGLGIVYVGGRDVGNVSKLDFAIETEQKTKPSFRPGGGNVASSERVKSVKLAATLDSFNNENLALALRGNVEIKGSKTVTDEVVVAVMPGLIETKETVDASKVVVVKTADDATTYVKGTDFEVTAAGIKTLSTGAIVDGASLKVTYETLAVSALEALVNSGEEVRMVFDGINDETGKASVVKVYRWKPAPTSGLSLIGNDYGEFDLEGECLADDAITDTGKSKFFRREAA
ncbi:hypothetical protein CW745_13885 [Psychromonas sp. psych-6C06]|uniref:phage tail tube protein n=1 Tax=Psychromonas sp. psych-6C06 TaxID=2058089 RepID=UPI000C33B9D8|nr:hypothetical protein [Psychromonas sp. psych-6C06]PKF60617.1 hypothetical protein CW745_13885 [Psychromonas sp. psych-6C06]